MRFLTSPLLLLFAVGVSAAASACTTFDDVNAASAETKTDGTAAAGGASSSVAPVCSDCTTPTPTPTASDGVKNGTETDVDCGGAAAPKCALTKACNGAPDCESGACTAGVCAPDIRNVTAETVINTAAAPITAAAGATTIALTPTTAVAFAVGKTVIVHQTRGDGAGTWERNTITALGGVTATLGQPLAHAYTSVSPADAPDTNRAQIVAVEEMGKVVIAPGGSITAPPWDGTTGGILAIHATNLTVRTANGITMAGKGYRGGIANTVDDAHILQTKMQGESYPKLGTGCSFWFLNKCGVDANAGGGAGGRKRTDTDGSGGGGGGYATPGTAGGSKGVANGGVGGATYGDPTLATLFFGSGGGAGSFSADPALANGGTGGGIVLVDADTITLEVANAISVAGAAGAAESTPHGGGGGGAGGSVRLSSTAVIDVSNVSVDGGAGGAGNTVGGAGGRGRVVSLAR